MPPAWFFCAPALGLREVLVILIAFALLVAMPILTYWRRRRMADHDARKRSDRTDSTDR